MFLLNIKVPSEEGNISVYSRHPLQKVFGDLGLPPTPGSESSASSPYPFLYFCCLALMRSILNNKIAAAMPRTHPQLPTHLCTQPTPSYLYTSMHTAKIVDGLATAGTCGWLLLSNKCLFVSFILPGFALFFKKKILPTSYSCGRSSEKMYKCKSCLY